MPETWHDFENVGDAGDVNNEAEKNNVVNMAASSQAPDLTISDCYMLRSHDVYPISLYMQFNLTTEEFQTLENNIETILAKSTKAHELIGRLDILADPDNKGCRASKRPAKHVHPS